jgi:hypothetical protein
MKKHVALIGIIGGLAMGILFNNCSAEHAGTTHGFSVVDELSFVPCAFTDEMDLFSRTYHPFLVNNCATCHVPGGEGKGAFSSGGLLVAYNAFSVTGYDLVSRNAVDNGHKPPYSGPQHTDAVNLLRDQWVKGLENIALCKAGGGGTDPNPVDESLRLETRSLGVNAPEAGTPVTIRWALPADLLDKDGAVTLPDVPGAELSIQVRRGRLGPKVIYEISQPTLKAGATTDIRISSILVKLNGQVISNQTTFRYLDVGVFRGETTRLAPGAMVVDGVISDTDVISLSLGLIEAVTLPPRPVLPVASFVDTSMSVNERVNASVTSSNTNFAQAELQLTSPSDQYVTVTVALVTTGIPAAEQALNKRSMNINFNNNPLVIDRWNWDFSVDTLAVVFAPGETRKSLVFKLSNDQRDEPNERIGMNISSVVNATKSGTAGAATLTIIDDDGPANPEVPTFSSLMQNGGILFQNCLECHNSVDNRGGYNLSDYDLMIENGVLVPYDVNSKMFLRMNAVVPGLRPMPLGGLLREEIRFQVENWILNGAKND